MVIFPYIFSTFCPTFLILIQLRRNFADRKPSHSAFDRRKPRQNRISTTKAMKETLLYSNFERTNTNKKVIENCEYSSSTGSVWNLNSHIYLISSSWITIDSIVYEKIETTYGISIEFSNNISINSVEISGKKHGNVVTKLWKGGGNDGIW